MNTSESIHQISPQNPVFFPDTTNLLPVAVTRFLDLTSAKSLSYTSKGWHDYFAETTSCEARVHKISELVSLLLAETPQDQSLVACRSNFLEFASRSNIQREEKIVYEKIKSVLKLNPHPQTLHRLEKEFLPIVGEELTFKLIFRLKISKTFEEASKLPEPSKSRNLQELILHVAQLALFEEVEEILNQIENEPGGYDCRNISVSQVLVNYLDRLTSFYEKNERQEKINLLIAKIRDLKIFVSEGTQREEISSYIEKSIQEISQDWDNWYPKPSRLMKSTNIELGMAAWIYCNNTSLYRKFKGL